MTNPRVSVVVAVFNGERYLEEALRSLFAQDYAPFEVIVVDDGSADRTGDIARSFDSARYVRQEHLGLAAARNAGIRTSKGDFIAFLDADDVLPPTKLSLQARYLLEHPHVACVLGRQEVVLEGVDAPAWLTRDRVFGDLAGVPFGSAMIRREILETLGGFDSSYEYAEDRDLFVRMRELGAEVVVLPDIVLYRRFHGANMNFNSRPPKHPLLRSLRAKIERDRRVESDLEEAR